MELNINTETWGAYLIERLHRMYENEERCDLIISCNQETFLVHRLIMSACSDYVRELGHKHRLILPTQISCRTLKTIINFVYTGKIVCPRKEKENLLMAARLLNMRFLLQLIENEDRPEMKDTCCPIKIKEEIDLEITDMPNIVEEFTPKSYSPASFFGAENDKQYEAERNIDANASNEISNAASLDGTSKSTEDIICEPSEFSHFLEALPQDQIYTNHDYDSEVKLIETSWIKSSPIASDYDLGKDRKKSLKYVSTKQSRFEDKSSGVFKSSTAVGQFTNTQIEALFKQKNTTQLIIAATKNENELHMERRGRKRIPRNEDEKNDLLFQMIKRRILHKIKFTSVQIDDVCFKCGFKGELLYCDNNRCPRGYHLPCVEKTAWPSTRWLCPWHYCSVCDSKCKILKCFQCVKAFCSKHQKKNIFHENGDNYACTKHKSVIK